MAVYSQRYGWRESGYGRVEITFRITNTYDELFADESLCGSTDIFLLDEVAKQVQTKAGGLAESEKTFAVDEAAVRTAVDTAALALVKSAMVPANIVHCAVFIDTDNTPSVDDMLFAGIIQPEIEGTDVIWHGSDYNMNPTPLRTWRIRARPWSNAIFDNFTLEELIYGTDDGPDPEEPETLYIDPIDSTWETANVADGQGWFDRTYRGQAQKTMVSKLVAVDAVLRKLADQLETGLLNKFNITMNINFERSLMNGLWHPTRWHHNVWDTYKIPLSDEIANVIHGKYPRWVRGYTYYADDKYLMTIDPDNIGGGGEAIKAEQFFISYRLIKAIDDYNQDTGNDGFMWYKKCSSFTDMLYKLAFSLGCYVFMEQTDASTMNIRFARRASFVDTEIYLRTVIGAKFQGVSVLLEQMEKEKIRARANSVARDGGKSYRKNYIAENKVARFLYQNMTSMSTADGKAANDDNILVTISPTTALMWTIFDGMTPSWAYFEDNGHTHPTPAVPHNHYFTSDGVEEEKTWRNTKGVHTALYMWVARNNSHVLDIFDPPHEYKDSEPTFYYTPVAALSVQRDTSKDVSPQRWIEYDTYATLSDFLNRLIGFDTDYFQVEYELDVPFYYGFSENSDGSSPSWKAIKIGSKITLDGAAYVIESIRYKLNESLISLGMSGESKYEFDTPVISSVEPPDIDYTSTVPQGCYVVQANEAIDEGTYVALRSDGKVEPMTEQSAHYGKALGVAIRAATAADEWIFVQTVGVVQNPAYTWTEGLPIFIRTGVTAPLSLSATALEAKDGSNDLHAYVAVAGETGKIILQKPLEYILK